MTSPFRWVERAWVYHVALDSLLVTTWLVSVGMVMVHEHGRLWGGGLKPFASLVSTENIQEQWFGIYYGEQKVGYAQTQMMPVEREGIPGIEIHDQGRLFFTLLGVPQRIDLSAQTFIDADLRLQAFSSSIRTEQYRLKWSGYREGDELVLTLATDESTVEQRLRDPSGNIMVSGLSSWVAFHKFSVGQWGSFLMLNPLSLSPETVHFTVRGRDRLGDEEVLIIETDVMGVSSTSWVTPDGRVLKEESPMGWSLIAEPQQVAVAIPRNEGPVLDLLATLAVPIDRKIPDPAGLASLTLLVEGADPGDVIDDRRWQVVLPAATILTYQPEMPSGRWCVLWIRQTNVPKVSAPMTSAIARYQAPSLFIQSDDSRIVGRAQEIVGGLTDPWQQAVALNKWVYATVSKRLTVGLPTAVDVLLAPSGDCHEHTVLFAGLARSLGIPTRLIAGLVYYQGQMYYHAWPEVWVGGWVPMDPTLGQQIADATHVALIEAENEQLIGLAKFVGQLQLTVLDSERARARQGR